MSVSPHMHAHARRATTLREKLRRRKPRKSLMSKLGKDPRLQAWYDNPSPRNRDAVIEAMCEATGLTDSDLNDLTHLDWTLSRDTNGETTHRTWLAEHLDLQESMT